MKHITFLLCSLLISDSAQIISQYVKIDSGTSTKGIEIWNNTSSVLDFSVDNLLIEKGTNGATPSLDLATNTVTDFKSFGLNDHSLPENSGTGKALIVLSNEVSATLSIYELSNITLSKQDFSLNDKHFKIYPNPVENILKTEQVGDYDIYNLNGQKVLSLKNTSEMNVEALSKGIYIIQNTNGDSLKFVKL